MKKILTCIDGSIYGQTCCQYALWFARKNNTRVDALYVSELWQYEAPLVADFGGSLGAQPYMGLTAQLRQAEAEKAAVLKEYVHASFAKEGLGEKLAFHHRTGALVDCIGEFENATGGATRCGTATAPDAAPAPDAAAAPAELLVIGKRGEAANMAKAHLGSNMERVVRASTLPCLVANREFYEPAKLLFAFDGSPSANKALAWFGANKNTFAGAALSVVSVVTKQCPAAQATANLTVAQKALEGFGLASECKALEGDPSGAIAAYQQETGANMLLMGAYGHSRIRRLLIGSTTVELLQRCRIPVVLFR
jgi:nucleotide-binding universal stress UspA family protein